jgi:glycerol-3-phosphate acyltransferase PlsY
MQTAALVYVPGIVFSYLLGAVPFGYIVARTWGVNIRTVGSGNIGATNVFRSVGTAPGILTFVLDASKGFCSSFVIPLLAAGLYPDLENLPLALACAAAAVAGHNWPVYLGFKGGKGVATSAGAVLGIVPVALLLALAVWVATVAATRYVSVASILAAVTVAAGSWVLYIDQGLLRPVALTALGMLAIWRHKSNITRLLKGQEPKINAPGKETAS